MIGSILSYFILRVVTISLYWAHFSWLYVYMEKWSLLTFPFMLLCIYSKFPKCCRRILMSMFKSDFGKCCIIVLLWEISIMCLEMLWWYLEKEFPVMWNEKCGVLLRDELSMVFLFCCCVMCILVVEFMFLIAICIFLLIWCGPKSLNLENV